MELEFDAEDKYRYFYDQLKKEVYSLDYKELVKSNVLNQTFNNFVEAIERGQFVGQTITDYHNDEYINWIKLRNDVEKFVECHKDVIVDPNDLDLVFVQKDDYDNQTYIECKVLYRKKYNSDDERQTLLDSLIDGLKRSHNREKRDYNHMKGLFE